MKKRKHLKNARLVLQIWGEQLRECPKVSIYEACHGIVYKLKTILEVVLPAMIVDSLAGNMPFKKTAIIIVLYACAASVLGLLDRSTKLMQEAYGYQAANLRFNKINRKAMSVDFKDTESAESLDMLETAKDSVWEFNDVGYVICNDLLGNILSFAVMSAIFVSLNPWIYPAALLMTVVSACAERKKLKITHDSYVKESKAKRRVNYCKELLQDQKLGKEVRAYRADQFLQGKYRDAQSEYLSLIEAREKALQKWSFLQRGVYLFEILLTYLVAVFEYQRGTVAVGAFLMYISASQELFFVVQEIFDNFVEMSLVTGYYQDYLDYMNLEEAMSTTAAAADVPKGRTGSLEFRNVSFTYPGQTEPTIRDVSFVIHPEEKIAFVGDNGAGKTTLIKLMLRLYDPTEGAVLYNGVDIRTYGYADYLKLFSCAFQDFRIFSYSLKENICFADENPEKLQNVIDKTMLDRVIQKCPDGVDTCLGKAFSERSIELSGGEQQSVAIARAFYKDGRIAVFDEPTAALDPMREHVTYQELGDFCKGRTAVFVSHRMGSTIFCNRIFVLEKGRIVEEGDHDSLMGAKGPYYDMYEKQACYYR